MKYKNSIENRFWGPSETIFLAPFEAFVWLLILRQSCRNVVSATYYYLYVNFVQEDKYNKISQTKYTNI